MEITTFVIFSKSDDGLALDNYLEQDFVSRIEGEFSMWGTIETIGCTMLRSFGVKVISEHERLEAYSKGEAEAERIFQPIYEQILRACDKEDFQIELNRKAFEQKESVLKDIHMDLGMSSITSVGALSNFCKTPEYMNVKFISKEDVKEYKEAKEEGYRNKIAEYETKIQEATDRLTELITKKVTEKFEQDQTIEEYKKVIRDYVKDLERQAVQDVVRKL